MITEVKLRPTSYEDALFSILESADEDNSMREALMGIAKYLEHVAGDMGQSFDYPEETKAMEGIAEIIRKTTS